MRSGSRSMSRRTKPTSDGGLFLVAPKQSEQKRDKRRARKRRNDETKPNAAVRVRNEHPGRDRENEGREHQTVDEAVDRDRRQHAAHLETTLAGDQP